MLPSLHNHITLIHSCVADTGPVGFSTVVLKLRDAKDHQGTIPAAIKFTLLSLKLPSLHNHISHIHSCVADTGPVGFSPFVLDLKNDKGTVPAAIKFTLVIHLVS